MKRLVLLAVAAISTSIFALPAAASAGEWEMDPAGWAFNVTSVGGTVFKTNNNETFTCTGETGRGSYNVGSKTTGTIELTLTGCKESIFGTSCSTEGQPAGTITTTADLPFTNVYLTPTKTTPGITIKGLGADKHILTSTCGGGSVKTKLTGSVLADSEFGCNTESEEHKFEYKSVEHGKQKYTRVTESVSEPIDDLTSEVNIFGGINFRTTSLDSTTILKSKVAGEKAKITCV